MLIVKKTTLICGAPGRFRDQTYLRSSQVKGMDYVSYFSRVYVLCFQQSKFVEGEVSTMWSAVIREFGNDYQSIVVSFSRELIGKIACRGAIARL